MCKAFPMNASFYLLGSESSFQMKGFPPGFAFKKPQLGYGPTSKRLTNTKYNRTSLDSELDNLTRLLVREPSKI